MFADIRSFTRFTRMVGPNEVIERLNKFFTKMTEVVYRYEGTIFELTGDEILVAFNAPFDQADAASRAVETAVAAKTVQCPEDGAVCEELTPVLVWASKLMRAQYCGRNVGAETRMTFPWWVMPSTPPTAW
ncbi:MAG: adenylate/guanylate cyclase domain-containing protein [Anaerolineaceae bacterium]|nr:adenylate/guanylate cyclase domain-containing protein [Anaerolineaceae bacterium]